MAHLPNVHPHYWSLHSSDRSRGDACDAEFAIGQELSQAIKSFTVSSFVIPYAWNNFTAARNETTLEIEDNGTYWSATIADGQYTALTLASALQTALQGASTPSGSPALTASNFTVTYNTTTLRMTVGWSSGTAQIKASNLAARLGFSTAQTDTDASASISGTLLPRIRMAEVFHIVCDDLSNFAGVH